MGREKFQETNDSLYYSNLIKMICNDKATYTEHTFKITWHASKFHQEATVRSYLKKYPPSASVMSPKVQQKPQKN